LPVGGRPGAARPHHTGPYGGGAVFDHRGGQAPPPQTGPRARKGAVRALGGRATQKGFGKGCPRPEKTPGAVPPGALPEKKTRPGGVGEKRKNKNGPLLHARGPFCFSSPKTSGPAQPAAEKKTFAVLWIFWGSSVGPRFFQKTLGGPPKNPRGKKKKKKKTALFFLISGDVFGAFGRFCGAGSPKLVGPPSLGARFLPTFLLPGKGIKNLGGRGAREGGSKFFFFPPQFFYPFFCRKPAGEKKSARGKKRGVGPATRGPPPQGPPSPKGEKGRGGIGRGADPGGGTGGLFGGPGKLLEKKKKTGVFFALGAKRREKKGGGEKTPGGHRRAVRDLGLPGVLGPVGTGPKLGGRGGKSLGPDASAGRSARARSRRDARAGQVGQPGSRASRMASRGQSGGRHPRPAACSMVSRLGAVGRHSRPRQHPRRHN